MCVIIFDHFQCCLIAQHTFLTAHRSPKRRAEISVASPEEEIIFKQPVFRRVFVPSGEQRKDLQCFIPVCVECAAKNEDRLEQGDFIRTGSQSDVLPELFSDHCKITIGIDQDRSFEITVTIEQFFIRFIVKDRRVDPELCRCRLFNFLDLRFFRDLSECIQEIPAAGEDQFAAIIQFAVPDLF